MCIVALLKNPTLQKVALAAAVVGLGFRLLLRARVLPKKVMQVWFVSTVLGTVFAMSGVLYLTDSLRWIGVPKYYVDRMNVLLMSASFRCCWALNPQITMTVAFDDDTEKDGRKRGWAGVPKNALAVAMNHTSFWDIFAFICVVPFGHILSTRTLMKSSLRNIPVFGGVFDRCGHFPVYFKSDEDGNFQVDKERQTKVQVGVDTHIAEGGNIGIYPEGAVNRNPKQLQLFRFGTFQTIIEHKMTTYYMVAVGNERTWSGNSPLGGLPADIKIRVGAFPIDFATEGSKEVAGRMQTKMQSVYDEILATEENKAGSN